MARKSPEDFAEYIANARNKIYEWVPVSGGKSIVVDTRVQIRKLVGEMADQMNIMCGMLFNMREVLAKSEKTAVEAEKMASAAEVKVAAAEVKVAEAETKAAEATKIVSEEKRPVSVKRGYANAVKKNEVIIKSGDEKLTSEQVKCHVMACVNPVKNEIGVARITRLRNGAVKINCPGETDIAKIKKALDGNVNVHVKETALKRPWMRVPRVDIHDNDDTFFDVVFQQNAHVRHAFKTEAAFRDNVRVSRIVKTASKYHKTVVVEVSREARQMFLSRPIYYRFESVWVEDNKSILQCFQCYEFGHTSKTCTVKEQVCGKCSATGHKFRDCKSKKTCCAVCARYNAANPNAKKYSTDHDTRSFSCPSYKRRREIIDATLDF